MKSTQPDEGGAKARAAADSPTLRAITIGAGSALGALTLYLATLAPSVLWGDSAKLTLYALNGAPRWFDPVGGHPLHTVLAGGIATLVPLSDYAQRVNVVSALFGSATVAFAASAVFVRTRNTSAALLVAVGLAFSHTLWTVSVIAESYSLAAALIALTILLITLASDRKRRTLLVVAGFVTGVGWLVNALVVVPAAGYVWCAFAIGRARGAMAFLIGAAVGGLTALSVFSIGGGSPLAGVISIGESYFTLGQVPRELALTPGYIGYQFVGPLVVGALAAWWLLRRDRWAQGLMISTLTVVFLSAGYARQRHFYLLVGAYLLLATLAGGALASRLRWAPWVTAVLLVSQALIPIATYAIAPGIVGSVVPNAIDARPAPGRDLAYFLRPWKMDRTEVRAWAEHALRTAPGGALLFADFTLAQPLLYLQQAERSRLDVTVVETDTYVFSGGGARMSDDIAHGLQTRSVVLAQDYVPYYFTDVLRSRFRLEQCGPLVCVHAR